MRLEGDGNTRIWIGLGFTTTEKPMSSAYPPVNSKMVFSRLAGHEVSTWSEEWKRECEIAYLAGLKPEKLRAMLYGVQGAQDESAKGIKSHRGEAAVAQLVSDIERFKRTAGWKKAPPAHAGGAVLETC